MANKKKGKKSALKDISKETKALINAEMSNLEIYTISASRLNTKKTKYLNKLEKFFIQNEENYLNKFKNSKSKLAKKINLNYLIRRFRKRYLKN